MPTATILPFVPRPAPILGWPETHPHLTPVRVTRGYWEEILWIYDSFPRRPPRAEDTDYLDSWSRAIDDLALHDLADPVQRAEVERAKLASITDRVVGGTGWAEMGAILLSISGHVFGFESFPRKIGRRELNWLSYTAGLNVITQAASCAGPGRKRVVIALPDAPLGDDLDFDAILAALGVRSEV